MEQLHGIAVINKSQGITSAKAISILKRLGQKKIGHAGTLDPMATGVLLVLLGKATKISNYLLEGGTKIYEGELKLGVQTDTWDIEGKVVEEKDYSHVSQEMLEKEVENWLYSTSQIVPPFSAAKHKGKPLYSLAREGKEVPVKIKEIKISQAQILSLELPYLRFRVECSSGTYIRSLAHSLGSRLSCNACLSKLTRTYSHPFGIEKACEISDLEKDPELLRKAVQPISKALLHWKIIDVNEEISEDIQFGKTIAHQRLLDTNLVDFEAEFGQKALFQSSDNNELALMEARYEEGHAKPVWTILRGLWH